jgi:choline dehydrogenase-like flavoprotein
MASPLKISPDEAASKASDFVIIGGGTAGLALVARLTEDSSVAVLVLEAGENRHNVGFHYIS